MHSNSKAISHHHRRMKAKRLSKSKGSIGHRIKTAPGKYVKFAKADAKRAKRLRHSLMHDNGPKKGKIRRLLKSAPKKLRNDTKRVKALRRRFIRSL